MQTSVASILAGLAAQLQGSGVPVWRASTSIRTLHPEVYVRNVVWREGAGCQVTEREHDIVDLPAFKESPVAKIYSGHGPIRCRLQGPGADLSYPICRELAAAGATDYVVHPLLFQDGRLSYLSWATNVADGFTDAHLLAILAALPCFAVALEIESAHFALTSLLDVYLGANAAKRVLAGSFKRGTGEAIRAAVWTCDLRGFTQIADVRPPTEVVSFLDRYFEAVGAAIDQQGGEILKFVGDAMLAVFPENEDAGSACSRALRAAEHAIDNLHLASRTSLSSGGPALELGVALHFGDVFYGNIGAPRRLDFTVIGAAVNEACRVESLCKSLGVPLLITDAFRALLPRMDLHSMGRHPLRGSAQERELFTTSRFSVRPSTGSPSLGGLCPPLPSRL